MKRLAEETKVRVTVRLTNSFDDAMARRGTIGIDEVRTTICQATVDFDGIYSVLPREVADELGLTVYRRMNVTLPDGDSIEARVTGEALFSILDRTTAEEAVVLGSAVRIGHTAVRKLDIVVDNDNQEVITNPAHPDGPLFRVPSSHIQPRIHSGIQRQ